MWPFQSKATDVALPVQPARKEPEFRITEEMLAWAGAPKQELVSLRVPKPLPGVVPDGGSLVAQDAEIKVALDWANGFGQFAPDLMWPGYTILAELAQRTEYRRISETFAEEMTRKWVSLKAKGDDADGAKAVRISELEAEMHRLNVEDVFRKAIELDGFFGRSHIYLDTGDEENLDELKTPLFLRAEKIKVGALKGLRAIEPIWTYPGQYNSTNPLREDFYRPSSWYVMGKEVHSTRLLPIVGNEVPDIIKPAYMFGGISRSQLVKIYVDYWLRDRSSVSDLLATFSTNGIKTDMLALTQGGNQQFYQRMQLYNQTKTNRGLMVLDKEKEDFFNVSVPLGGTDHLQAQAQEHVASASGMPLVKYTGITPSGLNASSDGEIRIWYDNIHAEQGHIIKGPFKAGS